MPAAPLTRLEKLRFTFGPEAAREKRRLFASLGRGRFTSARELSRFRSHHPPSCTLHKQPLASRGSGQLSRSQREVTRSITKSRTPSKTSKPGTTKLQRTRTGLYGNAPNQSASSLTDHYVGRAVVMF